MHAILLTQGLDKSRFDSLLICGNIGKDEGDMFYYALQNRVSPIFIPELKRELGFFDDLLALKKIYNIIRAEKPDIIHTHTAKAGALGRLAGIIYNLIHLSMSRRIEFIHTFHGHVFEGYFGKFKTSVFILIERFLALYTSRVVTVSESVKNELLALKICKENKIKVIPLGLELENLLRIPIKDSGVLNIGIIGRLVQIKNHRLFLEAAAKIIGENANPELRFKVIGDGELRRELEEYSHKLNISERVDFLGWQKDLTSVYSNLGIVALTSVNEGTPVSLIEAMAAGKPVVSTDVGGVRDLFGEEQNTGIKPNANFKILERGIAVNSQDYFSFADALSLLLQNNELGERMGRQARQFVAKRFTKDRLIKDIEDLYNTLLHKA